MKHRVLLVHPYVPARFNGIPLGLLYVAATTRAAGHDVRVLDLQATPGDERLAELVRAWRPTVVGLASTSPSFRAAVELARAVRRVAPDVVVVKGGVHETTCAPHTVAHVPEIDVALAGEADHTFPQLLDALGDDQRLAEVPGLVRRRDGEVVVTPGSSDRIDLDALPYPARDLLGDGDHYDFSIFPGRRTTQVQTMRGCPFPCQFCNQRRRNPSIRAAESVVAELRHVRDAGYEAVFFDDPTFTVDRPRTAALAAAIRDADLGLALGGQTRSELVHPQLLSAMAEAGFTYLSFGLETTNEASLLAFAKTRSQTHHLAAARRAVASCRAVGIASCLNLIVGFPDETDDVVRATFRAAAELDPDHVSLSALALYPHQDPSTAAQYLAGVSEEPVWAHYDEGHGAVHAHLSTDRAEQILSEARRVLGNRIDVGLRV